MGSQREKTTSTCEGCELGPKVQEGSDKETMGRGAFLRRTKDMIM